MRTFDHFPKDSTCKICGENDDKPCILVPIDYTQDGNICEAIPTHVDCLGKIRFNRAGKLFYIPAKEV